jgi:hypothetical protein
MLSDVLGAMKRLLRLPEVLSEQAGIGAVIVT